MDGPLIDASIKPGLTLLREGPNPLFEHLIQVPITTSTLIAFTMALYQVGQKVQYTAVGGGNVENSTTTGEIVEVVTEIEPAGDRGTTVKASEEEPRYVIKNDNTGKSTAYKSENIIGVI